MLDRTQQTGAKIQTTAGTAETLAATNFSGSYKIPDVRLDISTYKRELARASISPDQDVRASRSQMVSFVMELTGGGVATEAPWLTYLRAMGFSVAQVRKVTTGAVTGGTFAIGDVVGNNTVQASATKTGTFIRIAAGTIWYVPGTGTFASSDVISNYASPQVSTTLSGTPATGGLAATPFTETNAALPAALTIEVRHDGEVHRMTDARGKGKLTLALNSVPLLACEFMGVPVLDGDGRPLTGAAITAIPIVGAAPLACKGIPLRLAGISPAPVMTKIEIDIGNTLAQRGTITDGDFASSGNLDTRITERAITVNIDPEYIAGAPLDAVKRAVDGSTTTLSFEYGATGHLNGLLVVHVPRLQFPAQVTKGNRDRISTVDLAATACVVNGDDEISFFHLF